MTDSHLSDRCDSMDELVKAARTDRAAFGRLFDHFYPSIFAYCVRRLLVRAVAEDVASEVFLHAAAAIRGFSGTTEEELRRWLFRIATNEINAELRKSIRRRQLLEQAVQMGTIKSDVATCLLETNAPIGWQDVYETLSEMTDREQSLISLRFFAGFEHKQIAQVLEMKTGTVRVALSRALEKLRGRLQDSSTPGRTASGAPRGGQ